MNKLEFNIRLYLTGTMKSWTDRIDNTDQLTPQRFILNAMTELFDSLSDDDLELIRLRYMERLKLSEVASRYLLNEHTIRNHTNPTIKQVKEIIKKATEQAQHAREVD
ncbi:MULTISPECIES: sigma-70 family RNA polymerase sigma factor [unclassified Lactococcus]|uniref:sigma-70 family RNA polymerase sigma factor n=1 Tax=Lactococcus TaxID=1357 RepID=UPI0014303CF7|nr:MULTISPECIES: sigma-70 family RNA polymerase sigma factor [unclassified Lactococcus]KAF6608006.1 sigma-70 family RNA polymerase sigma factor [Lactococcus sp. EKM201L]KAF6611835.1 sigma-70 family RNA polymerase sigma factor [Lactococcus sp. EKM203L]KAF6640303.1 sigma-70 family RNA polymerase sigma factor [Lactococcus sp. EKM501L]KAF6642636.1 sigma-70 family RNA polymerase sigma factor [Lactococcus sp. EKM502L]KAF6650800.1 sigma-70 family RNA polymerase sigma factor [Lactococcus sp. EKM101L]